MLDAESPLKQQKPLTICELLTHRGEFADKLVTVRGELKAGPHGGWLEADPDCKYRLVTKGVTWRNKIWLQYPNNRSPEASDHADFGFDRLTEIKLNSIVSGLGFDSTNDHLFETVIGLFRTFSDRDLDSRVNPNFPPGTYLRTLGFGAGADAPAKLLIKARKDPVVVHGATNSK